MYCMKESIFNFKKSPRRLLSLPLCTGIPALISFHINSKAYHRDINNFRKKWSILNTLCTLLMTWGAYKKSCDPSMTAHAGNCSTQGSLQGYRRRLSVEKSHVSLEHKMVQLLFENFVQACSILRSNWQHSLSSNSSSIPPEPRILSNFMCDSLKTQSSFNVASYVWYTDSLKWSNRNSHSTRY